VARQRDRLVLPGAVDSHVHLGIHRDLARAAESETASALAGGFKGRVFIEDVQRRGPGGLQGYHLDGARLPGGADARGGAGVADRRYLSFPKAGLSLQSYAHLATDQVWLDAMWQSLVVAIASTMGCVVLDTFTGVILVHVVTGLPDVVITVSTALATFDPRLEQAARNLARAWGRRSGS
jgi:hypothetical protein